MSERTPTCFDCQHAKIDPGHPGDKYEPPLDDAAECQHPDIPDYFKKMMDLDEEYGNYPYMCGCFRPILFEKCPTCGGEVNKPLYSWTIYANGYWETFPVCSDECKRIEEERAEKDCEDQELWEKEMIEDQLGR